MACPNGHKGGAFCCEDHVNQIFSQFYERYKDRDPWKDLFIPVTLAQWKHYQEMLKEKEDE